jgi:hypothetical protein
MNEEKSEEKDNNMDNAELCFIMIQKMHVLEENMCKNHIKMMEGFRCIERAFQTLAGGIIALAEDLGAATGTLSSDPWTFDA